MSKKPPELTRETLLRVIGESAAPMTKRDIARAFGSRGDDRRDVKDMLRDLVEEGLLVKTRGQEYALPKGLPSVGIVEIAEIDIDGDIVARPVDWNDDLQGPPPRIEMIPDQTSGRAGLKIRDRALASFKRVSEGLYEGKVIRRLDDPRGQVMGMLVRRKDGYALVPASKRAKHDFDVAQADLNGAKDGDLVVGEIQPSRGAVRKRVRIVDVVGRRDDPRAISLIALHEAGLSEKFPADVIAETNGMAVPDLKGREDLRGYPLVTIDGADARDFDDAVFAEKEEDGGYHLIVAIADVSYYVRPGSALDREAYRRGNSTYFPDRVVPMLPEALSNDLCSLRPNENRACMAFHLRIDTNGALTGFKIVRGLMRSTARLTYDQVQAAKDGDPSSPATPLMETVIAPLYGAYAILDAARRKRGALDLDLPERQILIDKNGMMTGVRNRLRFDSHKLIEEFMILANVAAAKALEGRNAPCVYRVHDKPSAEKLDAARDFLDTFGLSLPKGGSVRPGQINLLLQKAKDHPFSHLVSETILRSQSQAIYSPENVGHFGLALDRYAHFTSPIRRYADLLVHRSLIRAYGLGPGGLSDEESVTLEERADHISQTERTSAEAERASVDRFTAQWMGQRIGEEFPGRINGVTRFGLFVTLDENGADGLVPIRTLPNDYYIHDEKQHCLIGQRSKRLYRLGAKVRVRVVEADGFTGSSVFEIVGTDSADLPGIKFKSPDIPLREAKKHFTDNKRKPRADRGPPRGKSRRKR